MIECKTLELNAYFVSPAVRILARSSSEGCALPVTQNVEACIQCLLARIQP